MHYDMFSDNSSLPTKICREIKFNRTTTGQDHIAQVITTQANLYTLEKHTLAVSKLVTLLSLK